MTLRHITDVSQELDQFYRMESVLAVSQIEEIQREKSESLSVGVGGAIGSVTSVVGSVGGTVAGGISSVVGSVGSVVVGVGAGVGVTVDRSSASSRGSLQYAEQTTPMLPAEEKI